MSMRRLPLAIVVTALASTASVDLDAFAQSTAHGETGHRDAIEEVIVTARKRDERLTDVPETITAFSGDFLESARIRSIDDLGRALPNVVLNRRGDNEPNVVIRGIGAFGNVQGIGFYIDDVQNFTDQASRLVDLERVEVLKGPQGSLYGGSSIGGAVKYVTRKPGDALEGKLSLEAGEQDTINFNASVNLPLTDTVFARISAYTDSTDGYLENPATGINNDESREFGMRAALRFVPSNNTDVNFNLRFSDLDNGGNDYLVNDAVDDYRYFSALNEQVFNKREIFGGILDIEQRWSNLSFVSLTSYTRRRNEILWDLDYSPADAVIASQSDPLESNVVTQEFRLAPENEGPFNWLLGAYYGRTENRNLVIKGDVTLGSDLTGGDPLLIAGFNNSESVDENVAAFFSLTYEIGKFEVGAGARLNRNDFSATNFNSGVADSYDDDAVLPKLTLSYNITDDVMVYGLVSRGYEPGKLNLFDDDLTPYEEETSTNYEIGVKAQSESGRTSYEIAGFYITNDDRQFETQLIIDNVVREVTANIGDSRSYGLEAAVTLRPVDRLTLSLNAGWLDAQYETAVWLLQSYDGNSVPYAPEFTTYLAALYEVPISGRLNLMLQADWSYNDGFFWDIPNLARQESYNVVGLRIGIGDLDGRWELGLSAQNLFDEGYYVEYNFEVFGPADASGVCSECHLGRIGQPRRVLGTLTYRF